MLPKSLTPRPRGKRWLERRRKKNKAKKVYRTNVDTISLNVEQFGPRFELYGTNVDPRTLRKKGSQICR